MKRAGVWGSRSWRAAGVMVVAVMAQLLAGSAVEAQVGPGRQLSLEDALGIAAEQSEQITMARAAVLRAQGQEQQARSELFPQLSGSLSYSRALASEFEAAFGGGSSTDTTTTPTLPPCPSYTPNPALPLEERVRQIESQFNCTEPFGGGIDFSNLPFGRENTYRFGLSASQNLFSGGRIVAQNRVARSGVRTAEIALEQAAAQLALEVTQAYYDAVLADRLLEIAQATLEQAETTLRLAQVGRQVGTQPEFELLRAQVTRDNSRPVVIQRQSDRDLAILRLKQLLNLPASEPIVLTSDLGDEDMATQAGYVDEQVGAAEAAAVADTTVLRSVVQQAEEAVGVQEGLLAVTRSQRLPSLVLTSQYGRVAYPTSGIPSWTDSRPNWTVGVSLSVPLFTGGRIRGAEKVAQANLLESQARLQQIRELAALDTRSAYEQLAAALASWEASTGTVEQAQRAYQIAEVRYREGISTQVELSDSRLLLQQANWNRAVAARALQVARARLALLPDLPLGTGGGQTGGQAQQAVQQQQTQQQPAPQRQTQAADASAFGF